VPVTQLEQVNANKDLTSEVGVFTFQVVTGPTICLALIECGDGSDDCVATGGDWELYVDVGSQSVEPSPQTISAGTAIRKAFWSVLFPVANNDTVSISLKSPNDAGSPKDDDVDVTVTLYDVAAPLPAAIVTAMQAVAADFKAAGFSTHSAAAVVALLNNLSSAEAQAACLAALIAHGVPAIGTGPNAVTWTFGADGLPLDDAVVYVYDAGGELIRKQTTDESGEVTFNLDDGTYTVKATKDGYNTITGTKTVPEA